MKKVFYFLIFILFILYACKKKSETPVSDAALRLEVKTQLFPSASLNADTLQAKLGSISVMEIIAYKGKPRIKQIVVSRTSLNNNTKQTLKDTLYNTQDEMIKINVSSNMGNITNMWKYEIIVIDEANGITKKQIHIRVGQACPTLSLSFQGYVNADSNRIKVQGAGLSSTAIYQYSYDNGVSWTYTNEYTYTTSGVKTVYVRDKSNPACVSSLTINVTGKKIFIHTIQLGAEVNTVYPNFYDVESKNTHFYSTAATNQNIIDWVYRTYADKSYLFSSKSAADSNYYNMNTWTTRLNSKFFNPVNVSEYSNAVSSIEIKAAQRGTSKDVSPALDNQICIPFYTVDAGNLVKANGIVYIKEFQAGANGYATLEIKYYLMP